MSKPVFEDVFKFSGRRNRKSYILLLLAQLAAIMLVSLLGTFAVAVSGNGPAVWLVGLIILAAVVAIMISGYANGSQRIRDFGYSGVWILLTLVPYVGWIVSLAIMFVPSSEGENRYGPSCI